MKVPRHVQRQLARQKSELERLLFYQPTGPGFTLHQMERAIRQCLGGNRAGKSVMGASETVIRTTGILPAILEQAGGIPGPIAALDGSRPVHAWVSSVDFEVSKNVAEAEIRKILPPELIEWEDKETRSIGIRFTGSTIGFRSATAGRARYQGRAIDWIWWDEEQPEDIYDECMARLLDRDGWFLLTFTPLLGFTWSFNRIFQKAKDPNSRFGFVSAPTDSNPFLPKELVEQRRKELLETPELFKARFLGEYTLFTARSPFTFSTMERIRQGLQRGIRDGNRWINEAPDRRQDYVIGVDPASGTGLDNSVAVVYSRDSGEQVCEIVTNQEQPDQFGRTVANLGFEYNNALVVCERNNHGWAVIDEMKRQRYGRIFKQTSWDKRSKEKSDLEGYFTSEATKHKAIDTFNRLMGDFSMIPRREETFQEMSTFVQDDKLGLRGLEGCKDDRVMASAMAAIGLLDVGRILSRPTGIRPTGETWNDVAAAIDRRYASENAQALWR